MLTQYMFGLPMIPTTDDDFFTILNQPISACNMSTVREKMNF